MIGHLIHRFWQEQMKAKSRQEEKYHMLRHIQCHIHTAICKDGEYIKIGIHTFEIKNTSTGFNVKQMYGHIHHRDCDAEHKADPWE